MADAAEFFKSNVRRLDVVARFGKTAFGIILPSTGHNVALVRQRLLNKISSWLPHRVAATAGIVVEIGRACAPLQGRNGTDLAPAAVLRPPEETEPIFQNPQPSNHRQHR